MANVQVLKNDHTKRRLFQGLAEDAQRWVEDNFPRLHAEPNTDYGDDGPPPDVVVVAADKTMKVFHGTASGWKDYVPTDQSPEERQFNKDFAEFLAWKKANPSADPAEQNPGAHVEDPPVE
jgi:hypothetical protein